MDRALRRQRTEKWKSRRKHKLNDRCGNADCLICHSDKVLDIPDRQRMRQKSKEKTMEFKLKKVERDPNVAPCEKCGEPSTKELHGCPFSEEINNDYSENCNCCQGCTHECTMDI